MKQKSIIFMGRRWGVNNSLQGKIDQGYYKNYYSVKTGKRYKVVCLRINIPIFQKIALHSGCIMGFVSKYQLFPGKKLRLQNGLKT